MGNLSYSADIVRDRASDLFLAALFIPLEYRETLLTLYALDVEMRHVHQAVKEEALGHIRYAWWEESLQMIADGKPAREHPVLRALSPAMIEYALPLVDNYRTHYPELPINRDSLLEEMSLQLIHTLCPQAEEGWRKANTIINKHRAQHGDKANVRLQLKLMLAGVL